MILTDSNVAYFLEEKWRSNISPSSYKKIKAALRKSFLVNNLGSLNFEDSTKFNQCWTIDQKIINSENYKNYVVDKASVFEDDFVSKTLEYVAANSYEILCKV